MATACKCEKRIEKTKGTWAVVRECVKCKRQQFVGYQPLHALRVEQGLSGLQHDGQYTFLDCHWHWELQDYDFVRKYFEESAECHPI